MPQFNAMPGCMTRLLKQIPNAAKLHSLSLDMDKDNITLLPRFLESATQLRDLNLLQVINLLENDKTLLALKANKSIENLQI